MGESVEPVGSYLELTFSIVILFCLFLNFLFVSLERKDDVQFKHVKYTSCFVEIILSVYTQNLSQTFIEIY